MGRIASPRRQGAPEPGTPRIDYAALFAATPSPCLVLDPDLMIVDVNRAYLRATGRTAEDLIGRHIFDAFPDNPDDPCADSVKNLRASLHRVLAHREPDTMVLQKYDIPLADRPGAFEERWWSPINTPVLAPDGTVSWILHRVEDVTEFVHTCSARSPDRQTETMEAELYARAQELQRLNEELRHAHARERQVALTLQEAMLYSPDLDLHPEIAVRYLPAVGTLNICGDWYDVVDLPDSCFAVAVGDVVGQGLEAAAVMGMLRSALSAAIRALKQPGPALEVVGLYARSLEGALATTAVQAVIDTAGCRITYSSAGHLPPVLLHADGSYALLDQATDPPLGTRADHVSRPQAELPYTAGDTLVLYTDGLIERRGEDIDVGLARLTGALARCSRLTPECLADVALSSQGISGGAGDDVALLVTRL
ncbi:PP2C family protein-serine/threonine phosphatase [Nonomuraea angiospora]|uniref:PAS domain S-box-containing protein n=1 Tax=Nonomuraea angiospora TaxID=46172 RepID=A0ABR9LTK9_9ACTN|nr:SpoIIE family protein phosphatase [Nonomuraea angiospora]MBE1584000.1 PAS domain S-box-containing protein [Nonomuraea angiospora]